MSPGPVLDRLETDRLVLRRRRVEDAAVFRELWAERDARVPAHRRIDAEGRPSVEDLADGIRAESEDSGPGILAVERKDAADVIGYCGLVFQRDDAADEPELGFELLAATRDQGYATEAGRAVVAWSRQADYPRLWATVWDWNIASRRVLEKLGFHETGRVERTSVHGQSLLTVLDL